jgi:hypothetical protein
MCRNQTLAGFSLLPPPRYTLMIAPYTVLASFHSSKRVKTNCTKAMAPGECLHMDFEFWDILSRRISDAATRILWLFCMDSKKPPLHILRWLFANLLREDRHLVNIRVNEDGALARSSTFTTFLRDEEQLNLETTSGYASFLNGKVEHPNRTLTERARCMLINDGASPMDWYYAIEHAGEIYCVTYHSVIGCSPHFFWYK